MRSAGKGRAFPELPRHCDLASGCWGPGVSPHRLTAEGVRAFFDVVGEGIVAERALLAGGRINEKVRR
jgi:hypothetical protein